MNGLTKKIKDEADEIRTLTIEEAKKLPNMLGVFASQMLEHTGFYTFTQDNKKVLLIRA